MDLRQIVGQLPIGQVSEENAVVHNAVMIMREFGYTFEEMDRMPLPTFATILEVLKKDNERQEREMKKSGRGRK